MSFAVNNYNQISITDRLNHLTAREQKFLKKSWAVTFADEIFSKIDEKPFEVLFCADNGRPNTPVNINVGSLLLKELLGLTDEEMLQSLLFDTRFQYALHLTSYDEIPYSDRTPSRFRERLYNYELETGIDLLKNEIERLGGEFAKLLGTNPNLQRMDSVMVSSSCKSMSRLELIFTCTANLVKAMHALGETMNLPANLTKYLDADTKNSVCYRMGKEEIEMSLETTIKDAMDAFLMCDETYFELKEYKVLKRMIGEQTNQGVLKENKEISPQSLQNPYDEDATYREKAGNKYKGYVGNFVEECGENGNVITHYDFQPNSHSDQDFCKEVIEELGKQEEKTTLIVDGAYASEANFTAGSNNNIELVATNLSGKLPDVIVADFLIDNEKNVVITCPNGSEPTDCKYDEKTDAYRCHFDKQTCVDCQHKDECPVVMQKRTALVRISQKTIARAKYVKKLSTAEYVELSKKRNGVEGIPSVLRRKYGVDNIPVRGLLRSKLWFSFKIGAINVARVIAAAKSDNNFGFLMFCKEIMVIFRMKLFLLFSFQCATK